MRSDAVGVTLAESVGQSVAETRGRESWLEVITNTIAAEEEALRSSRAEQGLKPAQTLRAEWSKRTACAQEISRRRQKLLHEIKEPEGTNGPMLHNYRWPTCRSTVLLLKAQHRLRQAEALERGASDIGKWMDNRPVAAVPYDTWSPI
jgi:hypothetical protein